MRISPTAPPPPPRNQASPARPRETGHRSPLLKLRDAALQAPRIPRLPRGESHPHLKHHESRASPAVEPACGAAPQSAANRPPLLQLRLPPARISPSRSVRTQPRLRARSPACRAPTPSSAYLFSLSQICSVAPCSPGILELRAQVRAEARSMAMAEGEKHHARCRW
jgi:hypothetical protein